MEPARILDRQWILLSGNRIGVVANSHFTILRMPRRDWVFAAAGCALFASAPVWGGEN
jgi:hypothetical protein